MYIVWICTYNFSTPKKITCINFCVLGAWLVMALRSPWCGVDLYRGFGEISYYWVFENVQYIEWLDLPKLQYVTSQELGWIFFNKIVSLIYTDFQFFLAVTAFVILGTIGYVIYKYSSNIYLSCLVFCTFGLYHFFFSGLRQGVAVSLSFLSYYFLDREKYLHFIILVLLASTFHNSALVFLIAYPLSKIKISPIKGLLFLGCLFCIIPFLSTIISFTTSLIFPGKYQHYENEGGAITMFLVYSLLYILSLSIETERVVKIRGFILFAVLGQSLGVISSTSMTRIAFYFSIFFVLLIPDLVNIFSGKQFKILGTFLVSLLFVLFFYFTTKDGYLDVIPYYFFWEKSL